VRRHLLTTLALVVFLLVWQGVASLPGVDNLLLASPLETLRALGDDASLLLDNAGVTLLEILLGLGVSFVLGAGAAIVMHLVRPLRDATYPLLIASQAIPIVTIAPLLVLAFDYGIGPKVAMVALVCFFPITVNLVDGLRGTAPELLKLMRSLGASRLQTLWKVELPSALPQLFSGLRLAATVSVVGAVFGEWAGAENGLGRLVLLATQQVETPRAYAGIVVLALMAIALFGAVSLAERALVPWKREVTA
jgi:ABC-type nitrate/sulfonate/bicarbonate transport system permease component